MDHKRRHLMLLQKVRESKKALSPTEIKELEHYENMAKQQRTAKKVIKKVVSTKKSAKKTAAKTKKTTPKTTKKASKKAKKNKKTKKKAVKSLPIEVAVVKNLAFKCATFPEADEFIESDIPLAKLIDEYPKLKKAWERGQFLQNLSALAATAATIAEAAHEMGLTPGKLDTILDEDTEAAEIWKQIRFQTIITVKKALLDSAKEGKPAALRQVEAMLRKEIATASIDLHKLTEAQLIELTGNTRQTIHVWRTKHGLMRNADNSTYSLGTFLAWFEEFTQKKVRPTGKNKDELSDVKKERLQLILKREKGELLDRGEVVTGLIARSQQLLNTMSQMTDTLPGILKNQPEVKIKKILEDAFIEARRELSGLDVDMKLPLATVKKLEELLKEIQTGV